MTKKFMYIGKKIRKNIFSILDIVLTESSNPKKYWSILKTRLKKEGRELATN